MRTTEAERHAVEDVLRAHSFSHAWDLTDTGTAEHLFLVDPAEFHSVNSVEIERELRLKLPGTEVGLSAFRPTPHVARIF